jgi:tRNA pseudouridine38-40 synthase
LANTTSAHFARSHARRTRHGAICAKSAIARDGERISVEVEANAFLHHMVRNIVGSLPLVGRGEQPQA